MIVLSIDVKLLEKSRFKPFTKQDGTEALYCELVLIETPDGKYGDYMVKQGVSKEDRAANVQMPILGNGKIFTKGGSRTPTKQVSAKPSPIDPNDPLPF